MSMVDDAQEIDVQPHPRLLSVLGDIEFAPWQCIAELVDNAFDDFQRHQGTEPMTTAAPETPAADRTVSSDEAATTVGMTEVPTVAVTLPAKSSDHRDAEVWVCDNGSGMSLDQLTSALRAGWTSNDRFGRLGLYGMGFNIATARLGHVTVVRTTRAGDPAWTVVTLDLRKLAKGETYTLPVTREAKTDAAEHGTQISIRALKPEHHDILSRQQSKIRSSLGDVYSYLLDRRGFLLTVDGIAVKPRRACAWSAERYVVRSRDRVPAVIEIDERLSDQPVCMDCGQWQDDVRGRCESCGEGRLEMRERRIWGWVGIQRYIHATDFGIDFIRNGRKILLRDLSMFQWSDPNEASSRGEVEYPIDLPRAGRIIGEIHVDHVAVDYQKNAFEYESPEWKYVIKVLRGRGPLLPKRAKEEGYPTNESPLARLFAGYRRADAGENYLIPGDGENALHDQSRKWAARFRAGEAEFQSDQHWFEAVEQHEQAQKRRARGGDQAEDPASKTTTAGGILSAKGLDDPAPSGGQSSPAPIRESEAQRQERWRAAGERQHDLETSYGLPGPGAALEVTAYLLRGHEVRRPDGERVPVYLSPGTGSRAEVFIDAEHEVFTDFAVETRDLVVMEIADFLRTRDRLDRALSALFSDLKARCLPDHKLNAAVLDEDATRVITRIKEGMQPVIAGNSSGFLSRVDDEDHAAAERQYAAVGGSAGWAEMRLDGQWVQYAPARTLVRLVTTRPESFMDGRVFRSAYTGLSDAGARTVSAARLARLLGDVAILADEAVPRVSEELRRGRLSCTLLERELAPLEDGEA